MVQAWYQGGVSVFDFSDSARPVEIAFFDRGPLDARQLFTGGYWSTYWYNGHIYGSEIARGLDVFKLTPSDYLSQNEIDAASQVRSTEFNPQLQPRIVWPATAVVALAYVDQLTRSKGIEAERARTLTAALKRLDQLKSGRDRGAAALLDQLDAEAADLERKAGAADPRDAKRLQLLSSTIKTRTSSLR
jgi:hypothetical protein